MRFVDTHAHLYLPHFDGDRDQVIASARENGVMKVLLPNIDAESMASVTDLSLRYPDLCLPMTGLHPTSVDKDFILQLELLDPQKANNRIVAIGETGLDAYWDKTFLNQQEESFLIHIKWAEKSGLPLVIHSRETMDRIISILKSHAGNSVKGVFHAFSGTAEQAAEVIEMGFKIGIGGVVTFKNSSLAEIVRQTPLDHILLETDSPYLTPVPYRGKRNESAYLIHIAQSVALIKGVDVNQVAESTTKNACELFKIDLNQ